MPGIPVVVSSFGIPVTPVLANAPVMTIAENGHGTPITPTGSGGTPLIWSPLDMGADLLAWWDASEGVSLSGTAVTAWVDKKSGYSAAQGTGASQPTYSATGFNGAPCVISDGTDDYLEIATSPFPINADPVEIWAVAQTTDTISTATRILVSYGAAAATARRFGRQTGNTMFVATGTGGGAPFAATVATLPSRHTLVARITATASFVSIDDTAEETTAAVPATNNTRFRLFANSGSASANQFWQGPARHIFLTLPLSAEKRLLMQRWLFAQRAL